jgi:hypothetical protein
MNRAELAMLLDESRLLYKHNPTDAAIEFGLLVASKFQKEPDDERYTDEWIAEQFQRTLNLVHPDEGMITILRIFGNRVLMQFGDSEGMHRAFSEAYERKKILEDGTIGQTIAID